MFRLSFLLALLALVVRCATLCGEDVMRLHVHQYNPLSLAREYRLEQIIAELQSDQLILNGIAFRQMHGTYSTWAIDKHTVVSWGWSRDAQYSNKSVGL